MQQLQTILQEKNYSSRFILCDDNTAMHCLPQVLQWVPDAVVIQISSGEEQKNIEVLQSIWNTLIQNGADRNSVLINLGGGVITDMGAFAAATYMRGISLIHIPTTLLAMVDASIGGKAAINFVGLKNMIGVFVQAEAIFIHTDFLKTLSPLQIKAGMAEVVKHALINGDEYCNRLLQTETEIFIHDESMLLKSLSIKQKIVEHDFLETGERKKLNLGHTVAHAIESVAMKMGEPVLHGQAVATGLIIESSVANDLNYLSDQDFKLVKNLISKHCSAITLNHYSIDDLLKAMKHDKKNFKSEIRFSILKKLGEILTDVIVSELVIRKAFEKYHAS